MSPEPRQPRNWQGTFTVVVGFISVVLVAVGLFLTNAFNRMQEQSTEQGQVTERFSTAIDQLGSGNLDIRLGGIYGLERLMRDSPADEANILEVLSAYVRDHAPALPHATPFAATSSQPPTDIQAALTVLGHRPDNHSYPGIDLIRTELAGADLTGADLTGADLTGADLSGAGLSGADLSGADLSAAYLWGRTQTAMLNLSGARLYATHLESVDLTQVRNLTSDQLDQAIMDDATKLPFAIPPPPGRPTPGVSIAISQPTNGAIVPLQPEMSGTFKKIPVGAHIWAVVYGPLDQKKPFYYPQGVSFPDYRSGVEMSGADQWIIRKEIGGCYVGSAQDYGKRFEILMVIANKKSNDRLLEYLQYGPRIGFTGLNYLPSGVTVYSTVTVTRAPKGA